MTEGRTSEPQCGCFHVVKLSGSGPNKARERCTEMAKARRSASRS